MKKHISILCIIIVIISTLTTTTLISNIYAQDTDPYVTVDKTATAYEIVCGQEILVNLTVTGTGLGGPFDIILVMDRSGSMSLNGALDEAKAAAKSFIDNRTFTPDPATSDWVGVVSYSSASRGRPAATLDQGLTNNPDLAKWAIGNLTADGKTNIMAGVHIAQEELATHGRDHIMGVMIVLSDGVANQWTDFATGEYHNTAPWPTDHTESTLKAIEEATAAKDAGTIIFTIGLNLANLGASEWVARDTLQQMATSLDYFFDAATPGYLEAIYATIATYMKPAGTDLTITDTVEDEFIIDETSFDPPYTSLVGNTITWEFDTLGTENRTFLYKIRPAMLGLDGTYATNVEANLTYTDHEGNPATKWFPIPEVELYKVCESSIKINKTVNPTVIYAGGMVTYRYEVTNNGSYPLHNVNVTDDQYPDFHPAPFDLAVGETKTFTHEAYPTETVTNWANATGKDPWNEIVTDLDDATVTVMPLEAAIDLVKTADPEVIYAGDPVTYNYTVTNVGDDPLTEVYITDDVYGDIFGPFDLGVGEKRTFLNTTTVNADVTNTGNATGKDSLGNPVTDLDDATVNVINPDIDLVKTVDPEGVNSGESVTYNYTVTNVGDDPLTDVYITDDIYDYIAGPFDLAVGEKKTFLKTVTVTEDVANTGNATGMDSLGNPVTDLDDATVTVITRCTVTFYTDCVSEHDCCHCHCHKCPPGSITIEDDKTYNKGETGTFPYGASLKAFANAPEGWVFDHWEYTGNITVLDTKANPTTVTINCGGTLTVFFRKAHKPCPWWWLWWWWRRWG